MPSAESRRHLVRLIRFSQQCCARRSFATTKRRRAEQVRIVEVGPRDGLQNEKQSIPLETKLQLVNRLAQTGLQTIEAGSFVSPKWVPQMANSSEILESLLNNPPQSKGPVTYQFLLPNAKGLENFLSIYEPSSSSSTTTSYPTPPPSPSEPNDLGPALNTSSTDPNAANNDTTILPKSTSSNSIEISLFTAATETFTQKNTNCSVAESLTRFQPILSAAKRLSIPVRAYISVALGCPFEGPNVSPSAVASLAVNLLEMGASEISVADTTGMGTPPRTQKLLQAIRSAGVESKDLAFHFHDTYGLALVNLLVALEHGVRTFDSAVAGLGGCPFSPGATGNVATEDLVHYLHSLGAKTGVDLPQLAQIGGWITQEMGKPNESRAGKATLAQL